MSTLEIKKRLINKIKNTEDNNILEEAYRLFEIESEDFEEYKLNDSQIQAISEAREQIKTGKILSADQADKETDQWLNM
jgi:hypothetical protein